MDVGNSASFKKIFKSWNWFLNYQKGVCEKSIIDMNIDIAGIADIACT
jgi:hypothetical protein